MNNNVSNYIKTQGQVKNTIPYYVSVVILHSLLEAFQEQLNILVADTPFESFLNEVIQFDNGVTQIKLSFPERDTSKDCISLTEAHKILDCVTVDYLNQLDSNIYDALGLCICKHDLTAYNPYELMSVESDGNYLHFIFAYTRNERTFNFVRNEVKKNVTI